MAKAKKQKKIRKQISKQDGDPLMNNNYLIDIKKNTIFNMEEL